MIRLPSKVSLFIESETGLYGDKWDVVIGSDWSAQKLPEPFDPRIIRKFVSNDGLCLLVSCGLYSGCPYIHASISRRDELPTYADLVRVKDMVFGPDRYAAMVFPPKDQHVNIHPNCLHLWGALHVAQWLLPEFSKGLGTI